MDLLRSIAVAIRKTAIAGVAGLRAALGAAGHACARLGRAIVGFGRLAPVRRAAAMLAALTGSLLRIAWMGGLVALALAAVPYLGFERVPPGKVGVRQGQWGGGIEARDYTPGLYPSFRGASLWHMIDSGTEILRFAGPELLGDLPSLSLRTREGNEVVVSAAIPFRLRPGEANRLVSDGLKMTYRTLVRATIHDVLLQDLAELTADEFSDTTLRTARLEALLPRLDALLAPYHVRVESVEILDFRFPKAYEQILQKKQLTRQLALLAKAATQFEQEMRVSTLEQEIAAAESRIRGEMDKELENALSRGKQTLASIRSEARQYDFDRRSSAQARYDAAVAEGERRLAEAAGLAESLTRAALDSPGGRVELARQAAANLRLQSVVLDAADPRLPLIFDLDAMTELLLGRAR